MTNQEAKEKIFYQWQDFLEHNIDYAGISEAYKMAIKALEQGDVLRELRQEIVGIRDCEEERPNKFGCDKLIAYERVIDLVDTKIKELSE